MAVFKGPTSKGNEGKERKKRGGKNDLMHHLSKIPGYATVCFCLLPLLHTVRLVVVIDSHHTFDPLRNLPPEAP